MRVGLVLSGGGSRGIAHLGVLKVLQELNVEISLISGASSGAIAGSLFSYGYQPDEILEIVEEIRFLKLLKPAISKTGLLRMEATELLFKQYFKKDDFSALKIPLYAAATDLCKGRTVYFHEGKLVKALMASACIPVIFDPIKIDGEDYIDGGILNNFPSKPLLGQCDCIIGSHCNPVDDSFRLGNVKTMFERTFLLAINANTYNNIKDCDLFLEPPGLKKIKVFDMNKARYIFQAGYEYAKSREEDIMKLIAATAQKTA
ncbi:MAG: patatin-like phospholipase family protein [Cyclobacteriaceae bacterium]